MKELIEKVLSEKDAKQGVHINVIASRIHEMTSGSMFPDENHPQLTYDEIVKKVSSILAADVKKSSGCKFAKIKQKNGTFQKGVYKLKTEFKKGNDVKPIPEPIDPPSVEDKPLPVNLFIGKAGECAVMSELLFRGYNVNSMLVDDGVDIVASKNNIFYYIQVKTCTLKENKVYVTIKQNRFNDFIGTQIRYIVVARCIINKIETNMYFVFSNSDIQRFVSQGKMKFTQNGINIKIEINPDTNEPVLYDEKREVVDFWMNKFDL